MSSDDIWTLKDFWINQTDEDCIRSTQTILLIILEKTGREYLDRYVEADGEHKHRIRAQITSALMREAGLKLGPTYWALKRWARNFNRAQGLWGECKL